VTVTALPAPLPLPLPDSPVGDFVVPPELEATVPAEVRGNGRDDVRLMASWRSDGRISHHRFRDLPDLLSPGDLLVVNTSATVAASVPARGPGGEALLLHLSSPLPGGVWLAEVRTEEGPDPSGRAGQTLRLAGGARARLLGRFAPGSRLWLTDLDLAGTAGGVLAYLAAFGRPIRYGYVPHPWPLSAYQNVYARVPGSAEMASAGRAFTDEMITTLMAGGIGVAPLILHTGVSSQESHEPPYPERFEVTLETADRVNATRRAGGRVIAVGTTVVRTLETVADRHGTVHPGRGWTELVVTPDRGVHAIDGLLTGWHEPAATHLLMLEAVGGADLVARCYREALAQGYLWHEFGDLHLVLP
jgi:S-adenosylmethionine:tRNA ribosyltransferase-isomerase